MLTCGHGRSQAQVHCNSALPTSSAQEQASHGHHSGRDLVALHPTLTSQLVGPRWYGLAKDSSVRHLLCDGALHATPTACRVYHRHTRIGSAPYKSDSLTSVRCSIAWASRSHWRPRPRPRRMKLPAPLHRQSLLVAYKDNCNMASNPLQRISTMHSVPLAQRTQGNNGGTCQPASKQHMVACGFAAKSYRARSPVPSPCRHLRQHSLQYRAISTLLRCRASASSPRRPLLNNARCYASTQRME
eukprot:364278-Chlamydomonas_euryale.AAC.1